VVGGVEQSGDKFDSPARRERVAASSASIIEAFSRHAEGAPEKPCLRFEDEWWTYGGLRGRAETFAATLGTWGLPPGERVAQLSNSPKTLPLCCPSVGGGSGTRRPERP